MKRHANKVLGFLMAGLAVSGCAGRLPPLTREEESTQAASVASLEAKAREVIAAAIRRTGERLGRPDANPERVQVEVAQRRAKPGGCKASATTSGYRDSVKIRFCAEIFLSGDADLDLTGSHEAVHAYFRRQLDRSRYRRIPSWLQEGIAIHLAGQAKEKLAQLLYAEPLNPEAKLAGLEATESYDHYFEYALALQFIDDFPGGGGSSWERSSTGKIRTTRSAPAPASTGRRSSRRRGLTRSAGSGRWRRACRSGMGRG